ncbi:rieske [2Fe-2S] domain protein [Aspergillus heteromorphus CBS 117.55]|uniref:Rieske [2Fe-2S] domain protein n=1 Tax=Aspergillus heteromorphus CBS 117.55 TaxID=1448321 RepID=A0A317VPD8_9EURO|nr:rieske [2Fe-2S] domain protein [Aspergillus heteromorphus CBS 117.55]PWY75479.1 rieske [2Fe-2S] domain protein [Aspergillus heteromorphus CBS 117.55]
MARIPLAPLSDLTQARYVIHLSDGKRLVLFRLPTIEPAKNGTQTQNETPTSANANGNANAKTHTNTKPSKARNDANGWSYYAMEAECPHAGGPMQDSAIDIEDSAYVVSCPWHAYDFNVETGESSVGIKACTFPVDVTAEGEGETRMVAVEYVSEREGWDEGVGLVKLEAVSETMKLKKGSTISTTAKTNPNPKTGEMGVGEDDGPVRYLDDNATVCEWCAHILNTSHPEHKIELTAHLFKIFTEREGTTSAMVIGDRSSVTLPDLPPRDGVKDVTRGAVPKPGRGGTQKSRINMLHALANIEQWAIDLAVDICVRFAQFQTTETQPQGLPRAFFHDWLKVANDEAKHFSLLRTRLEELGSYFGALPVHHGLWEAATSTAHDLRARISIIALVHEARGLDVNPVTIDKFRKAGDGESVDTLEIIHNDEITHVTTGHRWLTWICGQEDTDPVQVFRGNVQKYYRGPLREPFNEEARLQAGLDRSYYEDLVGYQPYQSAPAPA